MGNKKIRVLIANPTRAFRDFLFEAIREEPGVEVVGDVTDEGAIASATERSNPDCVIVPLDDPRAPAPVCARMLEERPRMTIVAVGEATDVVAIYWRSEVGQLRCTYATASREGILGAIRFSAV